MRSNPSTPGAGLRTLVRAEQARKAAAARHSVAANNKAFAATLARSAARFGS